MPNKEKIKGMWNENVGEVKEHIGRAFGNEELEKRGHRQEMKGKFQKNLGVIKEDIETAKKDFETGQKTKF